jgi:putative transposase
MENRRYPTDFSDAEWDCVGPYLREPKGRGRPKIHGSRAVLDAVFYILKSGCPWRLLPREYPPWKTVYDWFRKWRIDGTWERLNAVLRERLRLCSGRNALGLARASSTLSPLILPEWVESREDTTEERRSGAF